MKKKLTRILAAATTLSLATASYAAQVSFTIKAPTPGPNDIANLTGADSESDNVSDGDHNAIFIANDRPIQGQTFTTGTNAAGYQLLAVTLREVKHDTYALVPDLKYTIRVTKPSDKMLEVIATETAQVAASAPGNLSTIGDGVETGIGSGRFITFAFDRPVALKPNATYGFDVGGGDARHYWQMDGTASNVYSGGEAYSSGQAGKGNETRTTRKGDHVFVVSLSRAVAPLARQSTASAKDKTAKP